MAISFELKTVSKRIGSDPDEMVKNPQLLADWVYLVAIELEKRATQSVDIKMNVVDGEIFVNDLPVVGTGTSGTLWNDSGTLKIVP